MQDQIINWAQWDAHCEKRVLRRIFEIKRGKVTRA
jgi:hypothetical protein